MKAFILAVSLLVSLAVHADNQKPTTEVPESGKVVDGSHASGASSKEEEKDVKYAPVDRPPSNNLGIQDEQPQVVYPSPEDVNAEVMSDAKRSQLTTEQRKTLKQLSLDAERDKATPYVDPPVPVTRSLIVNLNAGVSPPVVRLARGQITSLVFSDMNGQPWYIDKVSINCSMFTISQCESKKESSGTDSKQNVLTIEPVTAVAYGNISVVLKGLSTPVIFILTSGQKEVDMRLDAKIGGDNPDSSAQVSVSGMPTLDDALAQFLDGVPPGSAKKLHVTGAEQIEAWLYQDRLYVRANAEALYPAYTNSARSTTGMSIYRFDEVFNSVTFTSGGQAVTAYIEQ